MSRRCAWLWLSRVCRWVLGGLFVYAGAVKTLGLQVSREWVKPAGSAANRTTAPPHDAPTLRVTFRFAGPTAFRDEIKNYQLGRFWPVVHPAAILMPWIEIVTGLSLILGIWVFESAAMIVAMLLFFNALVGSAMYRGLDIECGCFGGDMRVGWLKISENFVLVGLGLLAIVGRWRAVQPSRPVHADAPPGA